MAGYSGVPDTALLLPTAEQGPKYSHTSSLDSGGAVIPTTITSYLGSIIPIVPWATWLSALEASEQKGEYDRNPAIKILDFYRNVDKAGNSSLCYGSATALYGSG
jgi:hypothetical protein